MFKQLEDIADIGVVFGCGFGHILYANWFHRAKTMTRILDLTSRETALPSMHQFCHYMWRQAAMRWAIFLPCGATAVLRNSPIGA